jgi:hypothetical protein
VKILNVVQLQPDDIGGPVVILTAPGTWTILGINSYTKGKRLILNNLIKSAGLIVLL